MLWCCCASRRPAKQPQMMEHPQQNIDASLEHETEKIVLQQHLVQVQEGGDNRLVWAVADTQGRRKGMEDACCIKLDLEDLGAANTQRTAMFGVFDGHAGREVACYSAQHMPTEVLRAPAFSAGDLAAALPQAFLSLDSRLRDPTQQAELFAFRHSLPVPAPPPPAKAVKEVASEPAGPGIAYEGTSDPLAEARGQEVRAALPERVKECSAGYGLFNEAGQFVGPKAGSTAVVALIRPGVLVVCSVGDSRCVLCRKGHAVRLTSDHKPDVPEELERITAAGETVEPSRPGGVPRVGGSLAMSRALGDFKYKDTELPPEQQAVTAVPDVVSVPLTEDCDFMAIACDGVWDVMSPSQVVSKVRHHVSKGHSLGTAARLVVEECLDSNTGPGASTDNITLLLVVFADAVKV